MPRVRHPERPRHDTALNERKNDRLLEAERCSLRPRAISPARMNPFRRFYASTRPYPAVG
jgi:hypothetical protein